jgi:hypothetical protein
MKIISKFQDYYDIGIAYGVDEKLRFKRERHIVSSKRTNGAYIRHLYKRDGTQYRATLYYNYIGFCETLYPFIHLNIESVTKKEKVFHYKNEENFYLYDIEDFKKTLQDYVVAGEEMELSKRWVGNSWKRRNILDVMQKFYVEKNDEMEKLFQMHKEAYFVVEHSCIKYEGETFLKKKITLLPQLKQYKFAKAVAPMQAFQKISMYLGKLNAVEDNTVTIEDKYLAQGKGFDCYSFKKMPSKRKVKSC